MTAFEGRQRTCYSSGFIGEETNAVPLPLQTCIEDAL